METVFEFSLREAIQGDVFRVGIGALVLFFAISLFTQRKAMGVFVASWAIGWLVLCGPWAWVHFKASARYADDLKAGRCPVAEGVVRVTHIQPHGGHTVGDRITVGGQAFTVDYFHAAPGYHRSIEHGGALREGVRARVTYEDDVILRVEVEGKK